MDEIDSDRLLLNVEGVTVQYGKFVALRDVSYRIGYGQVVCLLGGNASGKSTSMKMICGTAKITGGTISWSGEDITTVSTVHRIRSGIGVVPEGRRMFASLSVRENLLMGLWGSDIPRSEYGPSLDFALSLFPILEKLLHRPAGVLSGGEQQAVAFGRALIKRPQLILMDEPSMGLSPALVKRSFEIVSEVKSQGVSVFIVEQNARAALKVADYAYVLSSGSVVVEGTPEIVADAPMMREAYLGRASDGVS